MEHWDLQGRLESSAGGQDLLRHLDHHHLEQAKATLDLMQYMLSDSGGQGPP